MRIIASKKITTNSLVSLHSSFTHMMEPRAKHGIEILFPASVIYSLNFMTDEHTESTAKQNEKREKFKYMRTIIIVLIRLDFGIFSYGNTKMASLQIMYKYSAAVDLTYHFNVNV